jgi:Histidine kinase
MSARSVPDTNRALYTLWALFWLLMITVAIQDQIDDRYVRWWEPLLWEGSSCLVGTLWLMLERRVAPRWDVLLDRPPAWFGMHLAWLPAVILTFIPAVYALRHGVYALTDEVYDHRSWPFTFVYETVKLLLFSALWLTVLFGLATFARWRAEREELLTLQKDLAESQLAQLRSQLQPHFLFNALNTISSLMQVDVRRADKLLAQLADLLRATLATGPRHTTTLREELEVLERYGAIMQARYADRATLRWDVADDVLGATLPSMLLQPLLENAYKHGVERTSAPVAIRVEARRRGDHAEVVIHNDGTLEREAPAGIGLANCRERLALLYGPRARLDLTADGGGVTARLTIPFTAGP